MRMLMALAAIAAIVYAAPVYEDADTEWFKFKATYGKMYKNVIEERQRRSIFIVNLQIIKQHNELYQTGESTYFLKVNKLADLTDEEMTVRKGYKKSSLKDMDIEIFQTDPNATMSDSLDWRTQGAVSCVKDQGSCGSCWAFSIIGSLEAAYFFKTGNLTELSVQNLVDCSGNGNCGCGSGNFQPSYYYLYHNDGIDSEASYPYTGLDGRCVYDKSYNVTSVRGYGKVRAGAEDELKAAVATVGPISVLIDADSREFKHYGGGVFYNDDCSSNYLDHAVLVVGYGTKNNEDYWLVKNSWSDDWGEDGYIKMSRNRNNNCGIASAPVYPLMY